MTEEPDQNPDSSNATLQAVLRRFVHCTPFASGMSGQLKEGCSVPVLGLQMALSHRRYLRFFFVPVLIQSLISIFLIGILAAIGWLASGWLREFVNWVFDVMSSGNPNALIQQVTEIIVFVILVLLLYYVFTLLWKLTGGIVGDYYGDKLTNQVMRDMGITTVGQPPSALSTLLTTIRHIAFAHVAMLVCAPLAIIPIVGGLCVLIVGSVVMLYLSGAQELSDPLLNLGLNRQQVKVLSQRHRLTAIGLAASKNLFDPIPVAGGIVSAAESLGRIVLALRIVNADDELRETVLPRVMADSSSDPPAE